MHKVHYFVVGFQCCLCVPPDDSTTPSPCASGTYSLAGEAACTQCPAGFYCTTSTKTACGAGEFLLQTRAL